ncbi:hypothetical protein I3843_11G126300 [Carya illinoinensis]|uniref:E4 SUMO-protein ligase PIAL2-like isoform X1 n=1 Tax=Carya illinoinensis TaxID=32201 RepID=UPI001C72641D|nr:E4 SUMO-protein ligase PIAL2-like isoform X1 [Carya illinoinensis]KAG7956494.1 hypothetical protein I3843_11G126300 [Carya illinoinensis]
MAGTTLRPSLAPGGLAGTNLPSPSSVNSYRVSAVVERLAGHTLLGNRSDAIEFFKLCLSLARGIDYAVANNEVPHKAQDLPILLKQVCQRKKDNFLQAAIMVLMLSVKNACKIGWFSEKESEELIILANEIGSSFCILGNINTGPSNSASTIKQIMERFYPRMRMGQILASLEVKPGYGAYVIDFQILKTTAHSPQEKIRLFVAQTDSIETSACIICPPQVSFLLNGKGVDRRTTVLMEPGPQLPTNVTTMLKYGTNLLQAVGQFNGHYIIAVAFISVMSSPDTPVPPDYVQPAVASVDPDSDIIEGPSRISLRCPISYTRIRTPVKGLSCKHLQCFDFDNFLDINSRRPSWRCPHCNQYVCNMEIRIDQNMVKVLREVGENVDEVIISADGSWKAIVESDDHVDQSLLKANCEKERTEWQEFSRVSNSLHNVLELTEDNNEMDAASYGEIEDRKPLQANLPVASNLVLLTESNRTNDVNQLVNELEDEIWSGIYSGSMSMNSSSRSNAQRVGGISESIPANLMQPPVLTGAVSPALNQEPNFTTSMMRSQCSPNNFQLQQSQYANSVVNNEYRLPSIASHVSRTPTAIQALPVQPQAQNPQQRPNCVNSLTPNCSSISSQNRGHQDRSFISASSQLQSAYKASSGQFSNFQNPHLQQTLNPRMPQPVGQYSSTIWPSSQLAQGTPILQRGAQVGIRHAAGTSSHQQARWLPHQGALQMGRQAPSVPALNQTSMAGNSMPMTAYGRQEELADQRVNIRGMPHPRPHSLPDTTMDENWRPRRRMRGSLTGASYDAHSQYIIQPTQSAQPVRPPENPIPSASNPAHPPGLSISIRNASSPQIPNVLIQR